ncbi:hypothetical protein GCM10010988_41840 [Cnuibacter physcomitrellae]|uniref:Uncharacterized protein n=1 Tax=Cnuibacter physcomitrellae TaxID=1619308 RepID=A0A1X9LWT2_9MICO|nr:zf-TFIIB domain-containing protein [Cnuibacter physcomitrellae]ARJ07749.1 hypothetical protein B5808_20345 [Cnuibacter physcomitrellae]GGI42997.1 hypothetical protein GCM10010988_41840 [Cnuibacter physcomitrellae]
MKCPIDAVDLVITERSGVEIDYCPQCRGVWLDRGELDKIIDRSAVAPSQDRRGFGYSDDRSYGGRNDGHGHRDDRGRGGHHEDRRNGRGRREGFLGNLFDF